MTENTENTENGAAERRLHFWLRAASRAVRTQFAQAARGGADNPAAVAADIDARITAAVSPEDYATTAASLESIARELGWDESAPGAGEHGRGFGRGFGFGPGFGPGVGFGPGFGGFGPGFRPDRDADTDADERGHGHGRRFGRGFAPQGGMPPFGGHRGHRGHRGGRGFGHDASGDPQAAEASFERGFEAGFRAAARP
ncbi:MAG: hypothetical protein NT132_11125 [Microbacterium sp.]|uniref:hypothetical protein n=1 Tax=Microbacterium sp. TaxID=51671 RepID=UPI00262A8EE8|nr:hypothetical protein [Microbacterium sp.]MCX6502934.1 hypothetical protein [Microbacterium sp.]